MSQPKLYLLALATLYLTGCSLQDAASLITPQQDEFEGRPTITLLDTTIPEYGEFVIISDDPCVADIQMRLLEVHKKTIRLEALADKHGEENFVPRDPIENQLINGEKCFDAYMLCGEQSYSYCFTLNIDSDPLQLLSEIK